MTCRFHECEQEAVYSTPLCTPYCAEHGVCQRCGSTVEAFVPYPHINPTIYVCPCMVAFATEAARAQEMREARQEVLL